MNFRRDWAAKRLLDKHKQMPDQLNYILKQKSDSLDSYVLMYISKDSNGEIKVDKVMVSGMLGEGWRVGGGEGVMEKGVEGVGG